MTWRLLAGLVATSVFGYLLTSCGGPSEREKQEQQIQSNQAKHEEYEKFVDRIRSQLAGNFDADTSWKDSVKVHPGVVAGQLFSVELERLLSRTDGRPIIFRSALYDIRMRQGEFEFIFAPLFRPWSIIWILKCDKENIPQFKTEGGRQLRSFDYLVVANITSVEKVLFDTERSEIGTEQLILSKDKFVARGRCVKVIGMEQQ